MKINELKEILYNIVKEYFAEANVVWGKIGGVKMPDPLVVLTTGAVTRELFPVTDIINGEVMNYFPSSMTLEINYFPEVASKENTAISELEDFLNYINSPYVIDLCANANIAINQEGATRDLTDLEYDTSWRYRAMAEFKVDFMQSALGYAGGAESLKNKNKTGYFTKVKINNFTDKK